MRPGRVALAAALATAALAAGCDAIEWQALRTYMAVNPNLDVGDDPVPWSAESEDLLLVPVVDGLEFPWDFVFLSESEVLVTEKPGRLSRVDLQTGAATPISGVPEVAFFGQGGLMGVELDPEFATDPRVYLAYSIELPDDVYTTRVSRARLDADANSLVDLQVLLTAQPAVASRNHFGGALEFGGDGLLYLSIGDRHQRQRAQTLDTHLGKIHRIHGDGRVPADNPFVGQPDAVATTFSYGHRNPQGLARHPTTGEIWDAEHGPRGGDEVNVIRAGRNYGWPVITYGVEYSGKPVGEGITHKQGMEQPVHYYVPSIATSGLGFYTGDTLPSWKGNLFVGGLIGEQLHRLALEGEKVIGQETLFDDLWHRVRGVKQSPGGVLYVLTENGSLFRVDARERRGS